jgi:Glucodextranase, domain N
MPCGQQGLGTPGGAWRADHGYRLSTTYITDPARDTVLMRTRLAALPGSGTDLAGLHMYARLDAHVNGNGGGGAENAGANSGVIDTSPGSPVPVISSANTVTNAVNRDYAVPTYMALDASRSSPTSTAAAFASRNYTIAPPGAWSQRLEVQGFLPPVWQDASGSSVGTARVLASQSDGTIRIALPESAFGTPGPGWGSPWC